MIAFAVIIAAVLGAYFTSIGKNSLWYECVRPELSPPDFVFSIVWSVIYIWIIFGIGIGCGVGCGSYMIILLHLFLNSLWSFVFFVAQNAVGGGVVLLGVLFSLLGIWWKSSPRTRKQNRWMFVIYGAWLCFALVLNLQAIYNSYKC